MLLHKRSICQDITSEPLALLSFNFRVVLNLDISIASWYSLRKLSSLIYQLSIQEGILFGSKFVCSEMIWEWFLIALPSTVVSPSGQQMWPAFNRCVTIRPPHLAYLQPLCHHQATKSRLPSAVVSPSGHQIWPTFSRCVTIRPPNLAYLQPLCHHQATTSGLPSAVVSPSSHQITPTFSRCVTIRPPNLAYLQPLCHHQATKSGLPSAVVSPSGH